MDHLVFGLVSEGPSEHERACWAAALECTEDFRIPLGRSKTSEPEDSLRIFLDTNVKPPLRECVLVVFGFIDGRIKKTFEAFRTVNKLAAQYPRIPVHTIFVAISDSRDVPGDLTALASESFRIFLFSGRFIDGSPVAEAHPALLKYFLRTLFSMGGPQTAKLLRASGLCAFGFNSIEYPLETISQTSLSENYQEFSRKHLEGVAPPFPVSLDTDFTLAKIPDMPPVTYPLQSRSVDDLLFLAEDEFDAEPYIRRKSQDIITEFKRAKFESYSQAYQDLWNAKSEKNLESLNIERTGNYLRESGSLNAAKADLLKELESLAKLEKGFLIEKPIIAFRDLLSQYALRVKNAFLPLIKRLKAYRRAKAIPPYIRVFMISVLLLFVSILAHLMTHGYSWRFRTKLSLALGASISLAAILALVVRLIRISINRKRAERELEEAAHIMQTQAKRSWDAWIMPQKTNLEDRMVLRALNYFSFLIESLVRKISDYQDAIRSAGDFFRHMSEPARTKTVIPFDDSVLQSLKEALQAGLKPKWNEDLFREFEGGPRKETIREGFSALLQNYQRQYTEEARRQCFTGFDCVSADAIREHLVAAPSRNIPVQGHADYSPELQLNLALTPEGGEALLRSECPELEVLTWKYPESICGAVYWLNIDIGRFLR